MIFWNQWSMCAMSVNVCQCPWFIMVYPDSRLCKSPCQEMVIFQYCARATIGYISISSSFESSWTCANGCMVSVQGRTQSNKKCFSLGYTNKNSYYSVPVLPTSCKQIQGQHARFGHCHIVILQGSYGIYRRPPATLCHSNHPKSSPLKKR